MEECDDGGGGGKARIEGDRGTQTLEKCCDGRGGGEGRKKEGRRMKEGLELKMTEE